MFELLRGFAIGLLFGVPAGAVGALTVQRTFGQGAKAGLLTGLGSSAADCCYAAVGVFGMTVVSDFLLRHQTLISLLGGGLILWMGTGLLKNPTPARQMRDTAAGFARLFLSSFGIGITNPAAIFTFLFAFTYFGVPAELGLLQGGLLVSGVFLGTYCWWGILTAVTCFLKKRALRFGPDQMNRIFGTILCLFGSAVFLRLLLNRHT